LIVDEPREPREQEAEAAPQETAGVSREAAARPAGRKKQIPLRLSVSLWNDLAAWAEDDFRSVNGQIEFLLTEAVRRRKNSGDQGAKESGC